MFKKLIIFYALCFSQYYASAQSHFELHLDKSIEQCEKASALIRWEEGTKVDSVSIQWSTGQQNIKQISGLSGGDYMVHVYLKSKDSTHVNLDSTIYFTIEKLQCPLIVPKYFSPNNDNYNDQLMIGNIGKYPTFELIIFNKQGQRVHHQEDTYEPWDGKWLGVPLPDGTYYYLLMYDKENKSSYVQGDLTILR